MQATISPVLAAVLAAVLATSAAAEPEWPGARDHAGEHYSLRTDVDPALAENLVHLLDAQYARLLAIFGKAPDGPTPLRVRLFRNHADYERLIGPVGGGMYTYRDRTANVWIQPHLYWTRHLLLHEATHQWMNLTFTGNRDLHPYWLSEGFAEYCAFHVWDGHTLRTELHDVITLQDYVTRAKAITSTPAYHVSRTLADDHDGDRVEPWALVHYLMTADTSSRKRLIRLVAAVPSRVHVEDADKVRTETRRQFEKLVSSRLDALTKKVRDHVAAMERTWSVMTIAWDRSGDVIEGRAETTGVLRYVRESVGPTAEISFRYRVLGGRKGWVGLAHGILDPRNFGVVTVTSPRSVVWNALGGEGWTRHGSTGSAVAHDCQWHAVIVRFEHDTVEVVVDGQALPPMKRVVGGSLGTVGLFIDGARADFRDFRVGSRGPGTR